MKIYTRSGDDGETGLIGGRRVGKDDPRIAAYGDVDELNAMLGVCRTTPPTADIDEVLTRIQHELFSVGAELAAPDAADRKLQAIGRQHVDRLESDIDRHETPLSPLTEFILPAGAPAAALLHAARCVCRRAERSVVVLAQTESVRAEIVGYLNRVGDLLFVLARFANQSAEVADTTWKKPE